MSFELVSVIMPAFNAAALIEESILSAQTQTHTEWELIVVDDGSTDDTASVVKRLMEADQRIKYIYQPNQKLGAARNTGLLAAKGEWIAYLDSDDLWMPDKLELQLQAAKNFNAGVIYTGGYNFYFEKGKISPYDTIYGKFSGYEMYKILSTRNVIPVLAVLMRRELIATVGLQDIDPKSYGCEDWDYWLRISKAGTSFYGIDKTLFKYRIHTNGMSQNRLRMNMSRCHVIYKNLDKSVFNKDELKKVRRELIVLIKMIIRQLYVTQQMQLIDYFLDIGVELSNSIEMYLAQKFHQILGVKGEKPVLLLLSNLPARSMKFVLKKVSGAINQRQRCY
jgi:teichuronic acid biosynthesis glycosyltransferase TuaG